MKVYVLLEQTDQYGGGDDTLGVFTTYDGAADRSGLDGNEFLLYDSGEHRWWRLGDYRIEEHEVQ